MYNIEQKKEYVLSRADLSIGTVKEFERTFELCSTVEEKYGLDLSEMDTDQLREALVATRGLKDSTIQRRIDILRGYIRWCSVKGFPNVTNAVDAISSEEIDRSERIRSRMVASPQHLQDTLDKIFEKEIENTVGNIYRCMCWMCFSGILPNDIDHIKRKDVDLQKMRVRYRGGLVKIDKLALPSFQAVIGATEFRIKRETYKGGYGRFDVSRFTPETPIVEFPKSTVAWASAKEKFVDCLMKARRKNKSIPRITCDTIWDSGFFYRMLQQELVGIEPDFNAMARWLAEVDGVDDSRIRRKVSASEKNLSDLYERWKLVF